MSFDLIFWIKEDVYSEEKYLEFLQECKKIEGDWKLTETHSFDAQLCSCYRDEYHTECYLTQEVHLSGFENNNEQEGELISLWIQIYKEVALHLIGAEVKIEKVEENTDNKINKKKVGLSV